MTDDPQTQPIPHIGGRQAWRNLRVGVVIRPAHPGPNRSQRRAAERMHGVQSFTDAELVAIRRRARYHSDPKKRAQAAQDLRLGRTDRSRTNVTTHPAKLRAAAERDRINAAVAARARSQSSE